MNFRCKGSAFSWYMQENGDFFAIFSLEDARVASYSLRAPHNATSVIGDPAEVRGKTTGKSRTGGGKRDINNTNVREAIVRPKGDKNINQQQLRVQQHSTRSEIYSQTESQDSAGGGSSCGESREH